MGRLGITGKHRGTGQETTGDAAVSENGLSLNERTTNFETFRHTERVRMNVRQFHGQVRSIVPIRQEHYRCRVRLRHARTRWGHPLGTIAVKVTTEARALGFRAGAYVAVDLDQERFRLVASQPLYSRGADHARRREHEPR